jgi:hypothetical protein
LLTEWEAVQLQNWLTEKIGSERTFTKALLVKIVAGLQTEIDEKVAELRAELNVQRSADKNAVIDLPNFLQRKRA